MPPWQARQSELRPDTTRDPDATSAVLKETDNYRDQPYVGLLGTVIVAAGTDGQQGALADNFTESLQLLRQDRLRVRW